MSTTDKMPEHKEGIKSEVRCAICQQPVEPNQPHQCKGEVKKDSEK
jgi:hypothetical protein